MQDIIKKIDNANWNDIEIGMDQKGYAIIPQLLTGEQCESLKTGYNADGYRKIVVMERYRFGIGEYKYFDYPLPDSVQTIRSHIYPHLASIANAWSGKLNIDKQFPLQHAELLQQCHENGQHKATALILKYGKGGFNTLHQDLYGAVYFPMQIVLFLSDAGKDYTGGEFVLTMQVPRAQSKAIVLQPQKGDILIFTTNFKPEKGTKGYYRVNVKHGVSELHSGERYTLGIIFHDAVS